MLVFKQLFTFFLSVLFHCWDANISFYLETSSGQSSDLYLNVVHFFNTSFN
jgi:hypothetical protein